jgi:soluble lytic murein transglycosylase-like protein
MTNNTHMTIQDYFKRAGLGADLGRVRRELRVPKDDEGNGFTQILDGLQPTAQPSAAPSEGGMGIRDYWKCPVVAKTPLRSQSTQAGEAAPAIDDEPRSGPEAAPFIPVERVEVEVPYSAEPFPALQAANTADLSMDTLISESIRSAATKYNLPAGLIHGVIRAESNFQPDAVSHAGAQGLMQLMPATAEALGVEDPFNIEQNIDGGARYLRQMLDMFGGNLKHALAAYNAGPGTVMRYNGNVPYPETRNYVSKVLAFSKRYAV